MLNLPNSITLARIIGIGIFLFFLQGEWPYKEWITAGVFVLVAATDALDGFLARRKGQVTTLGKFIDPLADKLLITAALIFLIGRGVPAWMAFVIIARELTVTGFRLVAVSNDIVMSASVLGKLKTLSQVIGIVAVLLNLEVAWGLMLIATLFTIISGLDYLLQGRHLLR